MVLSRRTTLLSLRLIVVGFFMLAIMRASLFTVYRVAGTSMLDTLLDGDRILVCDAPWLVHPVTPGDTVVFSVDDEVLVKRVIGRPGDRIGMTLGRVFRNGLIVEEGIPRRYNSRDSLQDILLAEDEYFVLGDHRAVSVDSREFGPIRIGQLIGKVLLRMSGEGFESVSALDRP
jgi:signal peptidase I